MKKALQTLVLFGVLLSSVGFLFGRVTFGSRDSSLRIGNSGRFNVATSNFEVSGTIATRPGSEVSGEEFFFNDGILENNGTDVLMTATYVPTGSDSIALRGSSRFKVEPGTVIQQLNVIGSPNRIEGQPLFGNPINLADTSTSLTIAIQNKLNKNINLNGGKIQLDDDLFFADDVYVNGPGRISLNKKTLGLGGFYSSPWSTPLIFDSATDVNLSSSVVLRNRWTFTGVGNINGNGTILDLSLGGSIVIPNGSSLYINDLYLRGLGNGKFGKIVFAGPTSKLITSNVFLEFDNAYNFTTGGIYVDGATTFVMKNGDVLFNQLSKLSVNKSTLWLDVPIEPDLTLGTLNAPLPIFTGNTWNDANVVSDIILGNLELTNSGTIKQIADTGIAESIADRTLLSGSVTTTVGLIEDISVPCDRVIRIDKNICIEGCGQTIFFTSKKNPQFIVSENVVVILKKITFSNIRNITFDLRPGARIDIQDCVAFEFSEDVTFSTNLIKVTDTLGFNIFSMRGLFGRRKISFQPIDPDATPTLLDLQDNTLLLQDAQLEGLDFIQHTDSDVSGAIALGGNAAVIVDNDTNMNFVAEDVDNEIIIAKDAVDLSGAILFSDCACNTLNFKTAIQGAIAPRDFGTPGYPAFILSGNPGLFVSSEFGTAGVIFDNMFMTVLNQNDNSFVVDKNSFMRCKVLEILQNPIKQSSGDFRVEALELLGQKIDPGFIRSPLTRAFYGKIPVTALHLDRERDREQFLIAQTEYARQKDKEKMRPSSGKGRKKGQRTREIFDNESIDKEIEKDIKSLIDESETRKPRQQVQQKVGQRLVARCPNIPSVFDIQYESSTFDATTNVVGNILVRRGGITNFSLGTQPTNITMDGSSIYQGKEDVYFAANHFLNIRGKDNKIKVTRKMVLSENICFSEGSELVIEFENSGDQNHIPTIVIPKNVALRIPSETELRFEGSGQVFLEDGAGFLLDGKVEESTVQGGHGPDCSVLKKDNENVLRIFINQTILQRPRLIFDRRSILTVEHGATAMIDGVGFFSFHGGSKLLLDKPSLLRIGNEITDDIKFVVDNSAEVRIDDVSGVIGGGPARLGFHGGTESLIFENGGNLFIGRRGVFEINAEGPSFPGPNQPQSMLRRGNLQIFDIGNGGSLFIDGILRIGLNDRSQDILFQSTPTVGTGHDFLWRSVCSNIKTSPSSPGYIQFVGKTPKAGFTGLINLLNLEKMFTYGIQLTAEQFAILFVQQSSILENSTLFIDASGKKILRTILGVNVQLKDGDVILGESGTMTNVQVNGRDADGKGFVIGPNGTRS